MHAAATRWLANKLDGKNVQQRFGVPDKSPVGGYPFSDHDPYCEVTRIITEAEVVAA